MPTKSLGMVNIDSVRMCLRVKSALLVFEGGAAVVWAGGAFTSVGVVAHMLCESNNKTKASQLIKDLERFVHMIKTFPC